MVGTKVNARNGAEKLLYVVAIRGVFLMKEGMTRHLEEQGEEKERRMWQLVYIRMISFSPCPIGFCRLMWLPR